MAGNTPNIDSMIDWVQFYGERGLHGRKTGNDKIILRCPFHDEQNASFWYRTTNGCFRCEACGASGNALDFLVRTGECSDTGSAYKLLCGIAGIDGGAGAASSSTGGGSKPRYAPETLTDFAQTKHFDAVWLRGLGLRDGRCYNTECVEIPYKNESGTVTALRRRFGAGGKTRFTWQAGAAPCLYGLWLPLNPNAQTLVLVEGESDALSLWAHNVPALGVPGASTFQSAWADALRSSSRVLLHHEPDNGGAAFVRKTGAALRAAGFAGEVCEISVHDAWPDCKDPSDVHVQHGEQWASAWAAVLATARPVSVGDSLIEGANRSAKPAKQVQELRSYSLADLQGQTLPPLRMIVPGLLTPGLACLAAPPKVGKTWLTLALALAVASGTNFLGRQCLQGDTLLYDLEGSKRRLQSRVGAIWRGAWPAALTVVHSTSETISGGGLVPQIDQWRQKAKNPLLVIVDTYGRARGAGGSKVLNSYENDSVLLGPVADYARESDICILFVLHTVKNNKSGDPWNDLNGSTGIAASMDVMWKVKRERNGDRGEMLITGRDVEEQTLLLGWQKPGWVLVADDGEAFKATEDFNGNEAVKAVLRFCGGWQEGDSWSGRVSDFVTALAQIGYSCQASPSEFSKLLRQHCKRLYDEYGLVIDFRRTSRGNGFSIRKPIASGF